MKPVKQKASEPPSGRRDLRREKLIMNKIHIIINQLITNKNKWLPSRYPHGQRVCWVQRIAHLMMFIWQFGKEKQCRNLRISSRTAEEKYAKYKTVICKVVENPRTSSRTARGKIGKSWKTILSFAFGNVVPPYVPRGCRRGSAQRSSQTINKSNNYKDANVVETSEWSPDLRRVYNL